MLLSDKGNIKTIVYGYLWIKGHINILNLLFSRNNMKPKDEK